MTLDSLDHVSDDEGLRDESIARRPGDERSHLQGRPE
jgi:hypothetical protein